MLEFGKRMAFTDVEQSSDRLLRFFGAVSGMKPAVKLDGVYIADPTGELKIAQSKGKYLGSPDFFKETALKCGVLGAVVVGSCTKAKSKPKDLDILLIVQTLKVNTAVLDFIQILKNRFDRRFAVLAGTPFSACLDVCGFAAENLKPHDSFSEIALLTAQIPICFGYEQEYTRNLSARLSNLLQNRGLAA